MQMTIDRIIFLRICEDRGIESYGQLQALTNGGEIYPRLVTALPTGGRALQLRPVPFQARERAKQTAPDDLTLDLRSTTSRSRISSANLYYPDSPYEFSVLPADILGQVYEQFLGKVIRLTAGHHAMVEDKPEVQEGRRGVLHAHLHRGLHRAAHVGRAAGGQTARREGVGKGAPLRVLDPACGSGSLPAGRLPVSAGLVPGRLRRARARKNGPKARTRPCCRACGGEWQLTTAERKRILLDHIYGVDIDPQAVEVTKLSLLLKVLEGENEQTPSGSSASGRSACCPTWGRTSSAATR